MLVIIVEGFGEVEAAPLLVRRWFESRGLPAPEIPRPIRVPKTRLVAQGELERTIEQAARRAGPGGAVLVLIDADDDCATALGQSLRERARLARADLDVAVVLPVREFEAWFLASAASLAGHRGLQANLESPPEPEAVRDAKGWLSARMTKGRTYSPRVDQAALAQALDFRLAARARSFRKFTRDLDAPGEPLRAGGRV
ncbi:MAG: DUF4276 family protein [Candidatus Rokuibacteriota bacterium]